MNKSSKLPKQSSEKFYRPKLSENMNNNNNYYES